MSQGVFYRAAGLLRIFPTVLMRNGEGLNDMEKEKDHPAMSWPYF